MMKITIIGEEQSGRETISKFMQKQKSIRLVLQEEVQLSDFDLHILDSSGDEDTTLSSIIEPTTLVFVLDAKVEISKKLMETIELSLLFNIHNIFICINKMDQVNFDEQCFKYISREIREKIRFTYKNKITFIPTHGSSGTNIIKSSNEMTWYRGEPLLSLIYRNEKVKIDCVSNEPIIQVQNVIHSQNGTFYGARILEGSIRAGQQLFATKSSEELEIHRLYIGDRSIMGAKTDDCITFATKQKVELKPNDILCTKSDLGKYCEFMGTIFLVGKSAIDYRKDYIFVKKSGSSPCHLKRQHKSFENDKISYTLFYLEVPLIQTNESYFIIIDPESNNTVAVGIINELENVA